MKNLRDIMNQIKPVKFTGDDSASIEKVVELGILNQHKNAMSWCNAKNIPSLENITSGTVICPVLPDSFSMNPKVNYIQAEQPRQYFMSVLKLLFPQTYPSGVAASARIHSSATVGKDVFIGENVVIEENCVVGNNTAIGHNTVIYRNTVIGNHVQIGANTTIGAPGFGYERNEKGEYEMIPHIGNVVIEDSVEIANNVCIDRAVLTSTVIRRNAKIDNQVHIAHNVEIGENSLIIANSMIAGSTIIGRNVWVAPCSSVLNKLKIGDNAFIGMSSVVLKDVQEGESVFGNPARPIPPKK